VPINQHSPPTAKNLEDHTFLLQVNFWVPDQCLLLQPARQFPKPLGMAKR